MLYYFSMFTLRKIGIKIPLDDVKVSIYPYSTE